ncbi:MAG TPA: diiron oxygenase [Caulobacteraceae bacterium]|jgi:hypothetical protein
MQAGATLIDAGPQRPMFRKLINASHKTYIDLETLVPWSTGVDRRKPPKALDQLWIAGTPYADALDEAQRLEVAWLEVARDASMFIHLEHVIPEMYCAYVSRGRGAFDPLVYEYLMLFAREELTHIMAFHRYLKVAGLPWYAPPGAGSYAEFAAKLPQLRPEIGIIFIMLIEWTAELAVMHATQSREIEPITRKLFRAHHSEEVRHLKFGIAIGDGYFESAPPEEADEVRRNMGRLVQGLHAVFSFNPQIADYTSFEFPVRPDDAEAIRSVQQSEHNRALNAVRFKELYDWCRSHRIL